MNNLKNVTLLMHRNTILSMSTIRREPCKGTIASEGDDANQVSIRKHSPQETNNEKISDKSKESEIIIIKYKH
jgi:hypothetical protein